MNNNLNLKHNLSEQNISQKPNSRDQAQKVSERGGRNKNKNHYFHYI
jgi:hypothetical protein